MLLMMCLKHYVVSFPVVSLPTQTVSALNHRFWRYMDLMHFVSTSRPLLHFAKAT